MSTEHEHREGDQPADIPDGASATRHKWPDLSGDRWGEQRRSDEPEPQRDHEQASGDDSGEDEARHHDRTSTDEQRSDLEDVEWTQVDTPGSDVVLERLTDPAAENTTDIEDPGAERTTNLSAAPAAVTDDEILTSVYSPRRLYRDPYTDPGVDAQADAVAEAERMAEAERARQAEEAARLEAERVASERAARNRTLGVVAPTGAAVEAPAPPQKLVTDKFVGAVGLFLFRLIVAAVVGIRGYQMVTDIPAVQETIALASLSEPVMAWVASISMLAIAVALLLGLLVRVAGFGLAVMMGLSLAFLRWGAFSPFLAEGFRGELELLLLGAGLVFLCLGGGRWGIDGSFRSSRAKAKAAAEV